MVSLEPVTDPLLLRQLNAGAPQTGAVTDPALLAQLNGAPMASATPTRGAGFQDQLIRSMTMGLSDKAGALASTRPLTRAYDAITGSDHNLGSFSDMYHAGLQQMREAGEQYSKDHPVLSPVATGAGMLASIPQTAAAAIPSTIGGLAKQGAQMGAIGGFGHADDQSLMGDLTSTGLGALIGGGTGAGMGLASRALSPQVSPAVREFMDAGGKPSLGQISGMSGAESAAGKLPFMTGAVNAAREVGKEDFNRITWNKVLAPLGEKLGEDTPIGHPAAAEVASKIGSVFNTAAKDAEVAIKPAIDFAAARVHVPAGQKAEFDRVIQEQVTDRLKNGVLSGDAWKSAREKIGDIADTYISKGTAQEEFLGQGLHAAQDQLQKALAIANPKAAADLANAGLAWRLSLPVRRSATYADAMKNDGTFTPSHLLQAVKGVSGEALASQGKAPVQNWASTAHKVIGDAKPVEGMGISPSTMLMAPFTGPIGAAARGAYGPAQSIAQYLARTDRPTAPMLSQFMNRAAPGVAAQQGGRATGLIDQMAWQ